MSFDELGIRFIALGTGEDDAIVRDLVFRLFGSYKSNGYQDKVVIYKSLCLPGQFLSTVFPTYPDGVV